MKSVFGRVVELASGFLTIYVDFSLRTCKFPSLTSLSLKLCNKYVLQLIMCHPDSYKDKYEISTTGNLMHCVYLWEGDYV